MQTELTQIVPFSLARSQRDSRRRDCWTYQQTAVPEVHWSPTISSSAGAHVNVNGEDWTTAVGGLVFVEFEITGEVDARGTVAFNELASGMLARVALLGA